MPLNLNVDFQKSMNLNLDFARGEHKHYIKSAAQGSF